MLNVTAYLERIGYKGPPTPDSQTLRGLHRAHMLAVPFENLDIGLKREITCDEEAFVRKIVEQRRGGFCYEMNGAFAALLGAVGFKVTLLSARVFRADGSRGPDFDHLTLRVDLDEPWLADVGFGDSFLEPLRLTPELEQEQEGRKFRIVQMGNTLDLQKSEHDGVWKPEYSFTLRPWQLKDFARMCHYHQTSPESPFTQKKVCSMATREGRVTLSEMRLIVTRHGNKEERLLGTSEEWAQELKAQFGVVL
jgi:N-hydroxyarylamine O-acetyltransferase